MLGLDGSHAAIAALAGAIAMLTRALFALIRRNGNGAAKYGRRAEDDAKGERITMRDLRAELQHNREINQGYFDSLSSRLGGVERDVEWIKRSLERGGRP